MSKIKIDDITICVAYHDEDGQFQKIIKSALTFESAEEALGKLERFLENQQK